MRSRHTRDIARAGGAAARGVSRTVHGIHTQIADVTGAVAILEDVLTTGAHLTGDAPMSDVT